MNPLVVSRTSAAILLGVGISFASHHMEAQRNEIGKSAFEAAQSERFDKFYAKPRAVSAPAPLFASIFIVGTFIGVYELLAFGIYSVIKPKVGPSDT